MTPLTPTEIKAYRLRLGYSRRVLAELLGVTSHTVALWEQGHRNCGLPGLLWLALEALRQEQRPADNHGAS